MLKIPTRSTASGAKTLLPPPLIFGIAVAIALGAEHFWPSALLLYPAMRWIAGAVLAGAGVLLSLAAACVFRRADTPISTFKATRHLVVAGPYRFSRNPDYFGQAMLHAGLALLLDSAWVLLALLPALILVRYGVIAREERYLDVIFGDTYRGYRRRVRRWF